MKIGWWAGFLLLLGVAARAEDVNLDWAYHDDDDDQDDRNAEMVPGQNFTFVTNKLDAIHQGDTVTLFMLTPHVDERDRDNLLDVRWWNGREEHWVRAVWQRHLFVGRNAAVPSFHGLPESGTEQVDLWRVDVSPQITRTGDNYYFFRYHVTDAAVGDTIYYIVRADSFHDNNLGQAWSPVSEIFARDWPITIKP